MAKPPQCVICLEDVKKEYLLGDTKVEALRGIDLSVYKGEFVMILGPSGCGKSTLLHILGLLDTPSSGKVLIDGIDTSKMTENERTHLRNEKIGFVFQTFFLSPQLRAIENVELPMIFLGTNPFERHKRAKALLDNVGLGKRINHLPQQLSGGERQRVAIARALSNNPSLILADEPTGNLDSKKGKEIMDMFAGLWHKGNTIVMVTHDAYLASFAPRIVRMLDGKIVKDKINNNHKLNNIKERKVRGNE